MKTFITFNFIIFFLLSPLFAHERSQNSYYERDEIERLYSDIKKAQMWCVDLQEFSATEGRLFVRDLIPIHNDSNLILEDAVAMLQHMLSHDIKWAIKFYERYPDQEQKRVYTKIETCNFLKKLSRKYSKILMKFQN